MRAAPTSFRLALALLFAALLVLRSLAPAGFMPEFSHGTVAIVACPDWAPVVPTPMHHHGDHHHLHEQCPYASVSALGALDAGWAPLLGGLWFFAVALLLGRTFLFVERQRERDRPPAIGPPIPA